MSQNTTPFGSRGRYIPPSERQQRNQAWEAPSNNAFSEQSAYTPDGRPPPPPYSAPPPRSYVPPSQRITSPDANYTPMPQPSVAVNLPLPPAPPVIGEPSFAADAVEPHLREWGQALAVSAAAPPAPSMGVRRGAAAEPAAQPAVGVMLQARGNPGVPHPRRAPPVRRHDPYRMHADPVPLPLPQRAGPAHSDPHLHLPPPVVHPRPESTPMPYPSFPHQNNMRPNQVHHHHHHHMQPPQPSQQQHNPWNPTPYAYHHHHHHHHQYGVWDGPPPMQNERPFGGYQHSPFPMQHVHHVHHMAPTSQLRPVVAFPPGQAPPLPPPPPHLRGMPRFMHPHAQHRAQHHARLPRPQLPRPLHRAFHLAEQRDRDPAAEMRFFLNALRPFASDSDGDDDDEDNEDCTICCCFRAVWHCDSDGTAVCEECLDQLVRDMPPGPLCCPDCRHGQIPAQTVLEAVSPDMAARYRSRRAAGLRGDGNQWLQTAVLALKAGTTLPPQPWTADAPAVPAGLSPAAQAAAQHEAQFVADLAREAQDDVRRAWERIRCITDPAALQSELDQLADESLAIACPTAKMCPRCEYGPVLNTGCNDLARHHGERQMSNCCRGCGFFGVSTDQWRPWDFVNRLHLPNGPATETDISRLASCANVTETEALEAIRSKDGNLDAAYAWLADRATAESQRNPLPSIHFVRTAWIDTVGFNGGSLDDEIPSIHRVEVVEVPRMRYGRGIDFARDISFRPAWGRQSRAEVDEAPPQAQPEPPTAHDRLQQQQLLRRLRQQQDAQRTNAQALRQQRQSQRGRR